MRSDSTALETAAEIFDAGIGLKTDLSFRPRLARALRDAAAEMKITCEDLVDVLPTDATLFDAVLERVTVQESGFFRHPEQFETLARVLLPEFGPNVNAWSAACANGQEAYSLAMVMNEAGGQGRVHASDVSPASLRRTMSGSYSAREMSGVSDKRRRRHFTTADQGWHANQNLRAMITPQRHNLLDPIPAHVALCQVVMCRNVLIYFQPRHSTLFLERLADVMAPTAWLFVGAAETVWQVTDRFQPVQFGASYAYRPIRRGGNSGSRASDRIPAESVLAPVPAAIKAPRSPRLLRHATPQTTEPLHDGDDDYERLGQQLAASGRLQQAVVAFRQWAYMSPDDPAAHSQLASALEAIGDTVAASRAHRAALAALDRSGPERDVDLLHGYTRTELRRMLVDRCASTARS